MSSNRLLSSVLVVLFLSQLGCDRLLRSSKSEDQKFQDQTVRLSPKGMDCLKGLPEQLSRYFKDETTAQEIQQMTTCAQQSLDTFARFTKGKDSDAYTSQELRHFLNRYLLRENQISDNFMKELMKIKGLLVGGSQQAITRAEMTRLTGTLSVLQAEALRTQGYWRLFLFKDEVRQASSERIELGLKKARESLIRLVSEFKLAGSLYEFQDLRQFVDELRLFLGEGEQIQATTKWIPLIESLKILFMGIHTQTNTLNEWRDCLDWALRAYFLAIEYRYQVQPFDYSTTGDWRRLVHFVDGVFDAVELAPVFLRDGRLQTGAMDRALDELWSLNLFKIPVSAEIVKKTYRMAILRTLDRNPSRQALPMEAQGLDRKHVSILRAEYNAWRLVQDWILLNFSKRPESLPITMDLLEQELRAWDFRGQIQQLKEGRAEQEFLERTWTEWTQILNASPGLSWGQGLKLNIYKNSKAAEMSFSGLNMMNGLRSLTRLVIRGYGQGQARHVWDLKISQKSLMNFEEDFRELGQAVRFLDPRSQNPAGRTFKEASFFTFHGNGDSWLSGQELFEELNLMISGGQTVTNQWVADGDAYQCRTGKLDILGKPTYKADCFKALFRARFSKQFSGLYWMTKEVERMTDSEWEEFYGDLFQLAALDEHKDGVVEFAEIRTAVMVLHYIESFLLVYDENSNGKLDEVELLIAAPRFHLFISELSPLKKFLINDIFLCMMYRAVRPGVSDVALFLIEKPFGLGEIGRGGLLKVLAVLKKDAGK